MNIDNISRLMNLNNVNSLLDLENSNEEESVSFSDILNNIQNNSTNSTLLGTADSENLLDNLSINPDKLSSIISQLAINNSGQSDDLMQMIYSLVGDNAWTSTSSTSDTQTVSSLSNGSSISENIPIEINSAINNASEKYRVDSNLIKSIINQESSFNPNAVSPAGAQGLMQLMPATASSLGVNNSFDINENINAGTKYIKSLLDNFNGDVSLALAAYNGGIGNMQNRGVRTASDIYKMPSETQNYVEKVMSSYNSSL
ncbi:MAG: lytic transglycosylase domain-containing protein [Clostridiaceae bacterium]